MDKNSISIVIPVYHAQKFIDELVQRCVHEAELLNCEYEIILIDDHSSDQTFHKLENIKIGFPQITIFRNEKNIGQHPTIKKGLLLTKFEWIIIMDCDLQDLPEDIPTLYRKAIETKNSVIAKRKIKQHLFFKKMISYVFHKFLSLTSSFSYSHIIGNFGIYSSRTIKKIIHVSDDAFYFPVLIRKAEMVPTYIYLNHGLSKRIKSTYSILKLVKLGRVAFRATKQRIEIE